MVVRVVVKKLINDLRQYKVAFIGGFLLVYTVFLAMYPCREEWYQHFRMSINKTPTMDILSIQNIATIIHKLSYKVYTYIITVLDKFHVLPTSLGEWIILQFFIAFFFTLYGMLIFFLFIWSIVFLPLHIMGGDFSEDKKITKNLL